MAQARRREPRLSARQIGYAIAHGLFDPVHVGVGSGDPHLFGDDDIAVLTRAADGIDQGWTPAAAWARAQAKP